MSYYQGRKPHFSTSTQFAAAPYERRWLVDSLLASRQSTIIGAAKKTLKTTLAIDLAVSLGTATPFLGHFTVPEKVTVAFVADESSSAVSKAMAEKICAARDVDLKDCSVHWSFRTPNLGFESGVEELCERLGNIRATVVIIDPIYLGIMPIIADTASMIACVAGTLRRLEIECLQIGVTPIVVRQLTKAKPARADAASSAFSPLDVNDLDDTGLAEFAKQWMLLTRRTPFEPATGIHELVMAAGGTTGQCGRWDIDVDEGPFRPDFRSKRWRVKVEPHALTRRGTDPGRSENKSPVKTRRSARQPAHD